MHIRFGPGATGKGPHSRDLASGLPVLEHARGPGAEPIGVTLALAWDPVTVTVTVSDSSPEGPVRRDTPADGERGRGLQVVAALSARWGWHRQGDGKAVFAVLAQEA